MRFLVTLLLLAGSAASAQTLSAVLDAIRRDFPIDHATLAAAKPADDGEAARRHAYRAIERFLELRAKAILRAPGSTLVAIEARQAAMLRTLERQDVGLCARVGDRGFFSDAALGGAPPAGLDDYGLALVAAAKAGEIGPDGPEANRQDLEAWLAEVARIAPDVPVQRLLGDSAARAAAPPEQLCRGAAAMHEAVGRLPADQAERVARTLLRVVLMASGPTATPERP